MALCVRVAATWCGSMRHARKQVSSHLDGCLACGSGQTGRVAAWEVNEDQLPCLTASSLLLPDHSIRGRLLDALSDKRDSLVQRAGQDRAAFLSKHLSAMRGTYQRRL